MKIGLGIDTHQLIPGNSIRLGGIDIPSNVSIKAHSDGDIIYHAIADSILGAIGAGDIGDHFPDTDPKNKNLDSSAIVMHAIRLAIEKKLILNNLDITLLNIINFRFRFNLFFKFLCFFWSPLVS